MNRKRSVWFRIAPIVVGEGLLLWGMGWSIGRQTAAVNRIVNEISELKDPSPFRAALLGHLGKIHLGLRGYLRDLDPSLEAQAAEGRRDFLASIPEFARQNPRLFPQEAREEIQRTFDQFKEMADRTLKLNADRLETRQTLEKNFSQILSTIDRDIRPLIRKDQSDGEERGESILQIENQLRAWQANLTKAWTQSSEAAKSLAMENENRGETYLELYGRMQLLSRERKMFRAIRSSWLANSDLARKSFVMENVVNQAEKAMDAEREQLVAILNRYLPAMPPSQLETRKRIFFGSIRLRLVAAAVLGLVGLASLLVGVLAIYRLMHRPAQSADGIFQWKGRKNPELTLEMDLKGTISIWTPAAEALYGYPSSEMVGESIGKLFESESEISRLDHELHVAKRATFGTTHKTKAGMPLQIQMEFRPVKDARGQPKAIGLICTRLVPG